jgi:hypothetical protein
MAFGQRLNCGTYVLTFQSSLCPSTHVSLLEEMSSTVLTETGQYWPSKLGTEAVVMRKGFFLLLWSTLHTMAGDFFPFSFLSACC